MDNNDRVLLVEGQDDEHVVRHLCLRSQPMPPFHIENKLSVDTLLDSIKQEVRVPGRNAVGILVDANDDLNARWSAVANRLRAPGELENFVSEMIPNDDPVWPRSQSYIDGIPKSDRKFIEKKIPRAKVHAWLATREEPRKMGVAIRAQDLRVDGPLSTRFANWLRQLFE